MSLRFDKQFWHDKKVLITGHTGFKGSWLTLLLHYYSANVYGISLPISDKNKLYTDLKLCTRIKSSLAIDINNLSELASAVEASQPDIVFHLAAQAIVSEGYRDPLNTWLTNVQGTLNLLHSLTSIGKPCAVIIVTTDKVYRNNEWVYGYREDDQLGGHDPYSASKAACEIAVSSWRKSFFEKSPNSNQLIGVATARAGNVIGGGDWSVDRLIPDIFRAFYHGKTFCLRNPTYRRPWQHVLEPICGYLVLAQALYDSLTQNKSRVEIYSAPFNFGPSISSNRTVLDLFNYVNSLLPQKLEYSIIGGPDFYESKQLHLCVDKSRNILNWNSKWDFKKSLNRTVRWYLDFNTLSASVEKLCNDDIVEYFGNL